MSAEGDNVTHRVEGGVSEECHQVLFLCNPNGESAEKKVRDRLREHRIDEVDVDNSVHGRRYRVERSCEGREAQDTDGGAGVGAIGLGTGDHPEDEVVLIGFNNGEEGSNWRSNGGGLVRLP